MNAHFVPVITRFARQLAGPLAVIGSAVGLPDHAHSAPTLQGLALTRLTTEVRELKRLVFQLKRDEAKARAQRDRLKKDRDNAAGFAGGGKHFLYRAGFVATVQQLEQSPGQASLLQAAVPALSTDQFVPPSKVGFTGGDVADLLQFCRKQNVGVRYGSRAQLVIAELARDALHQADEKIARLDETIEVLKAQNIAHTDILGNLILAQAHCHHCHHCYHYGYGYCGVASVLDYPPAGLASKAYDVSPLREFRNRNKPTVETDHRRLKFLKSDDDSQTATNDVAVAEPE